MEHVFCMWVARNWSGILQRLFVSVLLLNGTTSVPSKHRLGWWRCSHVNWIVMMMIIMMMINAFLEDLCLVAKYQRGACVHYGRLDYGRSRCDREFQCRRGNCMKSLIIHSLELDSHYLVFVCTWPGTYDVPVSRCSQPCAVGQIKRVQQGDACCWVCTPCDPVEFVSDEQTCVACSEGWWPTADRRHCYRLEEQYMRWDSPFAIVPAALSAVGLTFTGIVVAMFVRHFETPVVKASGRELSFMLFAGFAICYLMTFVILAKPGVLVCGAQRFGVGFGFAVTYAALLTKTNRISRIFDSARHTAKRPPFISPRSQVRQPVGKHRLLNRDAHSKV